MLVWVQPWPGLTLPPAHALKWGVSLARPAFALSCYLLLWIYLSKPHRPWLPVFLMSPSSSLHMGLTFSQNYRMADAGRTLVVIWANTSVQVGQHRDTCPGPYPDGFWISPRRKTTTSLGNLCHCSVTRTVKMCFLMFRQNLLCSTWCPVPLAPAHGTTEKSLAPSSLHLLLRYLYTLIRLPLSLLHAML